MYGHLCLASGTTQEAIHATQSLLASLHVTCDVCVLLASNTICLACVDVIYCLLTPLMSHNYTKHALVELIDRICTMTICTTM